MTIKGKQLLIIFIVIISFGAIFLQWRSAMNTTSHFKIATTQRHAEELKDLSALGNQYGFQVQVDIYDTSREILQAFYSGEADAFTLDAFTFISQFYRLEHSKAILGIPVKYYFITLKEKTLPTRATIGVYDELLATYILADPTINLVSYDDERQMTAALEEGQLDGLFIPEDLYDIEKHMLVMQSDYRGYYEDLFIITDKWINDQSTDKYEFATAFYRMLHEKFPDPEEESLLAIMTRLFTDLQISTRYYYEDLVWKPDTLK